MWNMCVYVFVRAHMRVCESASVCVRVLACVCCVLSVRKVGGSVLGALRLHLRVNSMGAMWCNSLTRFGLMSGYCVRCNN